MTHVSVAVYLVETGLLLAIAPWTMMWQRNYFADLMPWLGSAMETGGARGVVVTAGVVTALAGMKDLKAALTARPPAAPPASLERPSGDEPTES